MYPWKLLSQWEWVINWLGKKFTAKRLIYYYEITSAQSATSYARLKDCPGTHTPLRSRNTLFQSHGRNLLISSVLNSATTSSFSWDFDQYPLGKLTVFPYQDVLFAMGIQFKIGSAQGSVCSITLPHSTSIVKIGHAMKEINRLANANDQAGERDVLHFRRHSWILRVLMEITR
jgi:hypothetical protein